MRQKRHDRDTNGDKGTATKARRFSIGDLVVAGRPNDLARARYLIAVQRCVPTALKELATVAWRASADVDDRVGETMLSTWAKHRGFADDWAFACARENVEIWRRHPNLSGRWSLLVQGEGRAATAARSTSPDAHPVVVGDDAIAEPVCHCRHL
jgi:hypothetical protein